MGVATPLGSDQRATASQSLMAATDEAAFHHAALASPAESPAQAPSDTLPDRPGHALADDLHDLPDELTPPTTALRQPAESYSPMQVDPLRSASHAPATPRKPPRASLFA